MLGVSFVAVTILMPSSIEGKNTPFFFNLVYVMRENLY
jgi:hypothetical protein